MLSSGQVETVFMLSSPTSAEQLSLSVVSLEQFEQGYLCVLALAVTVFGFNAIGMVAAFMRVLEKKKLVASQRRKRNKNVKKIGAHIFQRK